MDAIMDSVIIHHLQRFKLRYLFFVKLIKEPQRFLLKKKQPNHLPTNHLHFF